MNPTRSIRNLRQEVPIESVAIVSVLTAAIAASEALLFFDYVLYSLGAYTLLLFVLPLAPLLFETETPLFQAFALIPVFRLVNLAMPIFFELSLLWLPLVYGSFIPVFVYLGWRNSRDEPDNAEIDTETGTALVGIGYELPWWLGGNRSGKLRRQFRRIWRFLATPEDASTKRSIVHWIVQGLFLVLVPVIGVVFLVSMGVAIVYLAEFDFGIITPAPLIPSLDFYHLGLLTVTMVVFVGFVEELLFRGVIQKVLERRLGLVPGLLIASGIFGLMHSGYGVRMEIVFAAGFGLLFGIVYDLTDSLVLVSVMHGLMNVLLFGVIPLDGGSSMDLLRPIAERELQRFGLAWIVDLLPRLDLCVLVGSF